MTYLEIFFVFLTIGYFASWLFAIWFKEIYHKENGI